PAVGAIIRLIASSRRDWGHALTKLKHTCRFGSGAAKRRLACIVGSGAEFEPALPAEYQLPGDSLLVALVEPAVVAGGAVLDKEDALITEATPAQLISERYLSGVKNLLVAFDECQPSAAPVPTAGSGIAGTAKCDRAASHDGFGSGFLNSVLN